MRARALLVSTLCVACTSSSRTDTDPVQPQRDGGSIEEPDASGPPQPPPADGTMPPLGDEIDRVGRAGIDTLVNQSFGDPLEAVRMFDGMDRHCGNAFWSIAGQVEGRYDKVTARLADDQLYVDTRAKSCWFYLGLETEEMGVMPNADCGGRTLTEDVVDLTYALLINNLRGPIHDGVARDDRTPSNEVFPFVAEPPPEAASPVPPPSQPDPEPVFEANNRSCKDLGYTDDVGPGGGASPFGASCALNSQCAGDNGICLLNTCFYGGYCTVTCELDSDCAPNMVCRMVGAHACVRTCATDADCGRAGYHCGPESYCISQ